MVNILGGHFDVTDLFVKNCVTVSLVVDFYGNPIKMKVNLCIIYGVSRGIIGT